MKNLVNLQDTKSTQNKSIVISHNKNEQHEIEIRKTPAFTIVLTGKKNPFGINLRGEGLVY